MSLVGWVLRRRSCPHCTVCPVCRRHTTTYSLDSVVKHFCIAHGWFRNAA